MATGVPLADGAVVDRDDHFGLFARRAVERGRGVVGERRRRRNVTAGGSVYTSNVTGALFARLLPIELCAEATAVYLCRPLAGRFLPERVDQFPPCTIGRSPAHDRALGARTFVYARRSPLPAGRDTVPENDGFVLFDGEAGACDRSRSARFVSTSNVAGALCPTGFPRASSARSRSPCTCRFRVLS